MRTHWYNVSSSTYLPTYVCIYLGSDAYWPSFRSGGVVLAHTHTHEVNSDNLSCVHTVTAVECRVCFVGGFVFVCAPRLLLQHFQPWLLACASGAYYIIARYKSSGQFIKYGRVTGLKVQPARQADRLQVSDVSVEGSGGPPLRGVWVGLSGWQAPRQWANIILF